MKNLTASDRKSLIRLASSLPKGDKGRRAILAGLNKVSAHWPRVTAETVTHPFYQNLSAFTSAVSEFTSEFSKAFNPKKVKVTNYSKQVYYWMIVSVQPTRGMEVADISFKFDSNGLKVSGKCVQKGQPLGYSPKQDVMPPSIAKEFERNPGKAGRMFAEFCSERIPSDWGVLKGTSKPEKPKKSPLEVAMSGAARHFKSLAKKSGIDAAAMLSIQTYELPGAISINWNSDMHLSPEHQQDYPGLYEGDKISYDTLLKSWSETMSKYAPRLRKLGIRDVTNMASWENNKYTRPVFRLSV